MYFSLENSLLIVKYSTGEECKVAAIQTFRVYLLVIPLWYTKTIMSGWID